MNYEQMTFIDERVSRGGQLTVVSGGFPCQPHSIAGKRKASSDERDLWPEYRRVISEIRPKWVVAENVRGLLSSEDGRFFRGILRDLANLGYDVGWCCYRAADVGAIHPRERVGVIAHSSSERVLEQQIKEHSTERDKAFYGTNRQIETIADIDCFFEECNIEKQIPWKQILQGSEATRGVEEWTRRCNLYQPKLLRNFHGIPRAMDRIKCLGNTVVPQQFFPIFKAIAEIEREEVS